MTVIRATPHWDDKLTPPQCKRRLDCAYSEEMPAANAQDCVACPYLVDPVNYLGGIYNRYAAPEEDA